jgi:polar amino acid transport system permease protein
MLPSLLQGVWITVETLVFSVILGLSIAFLAGLGRLSKHTWVGKTTGFYVEVFRGTSLLVQMFWFYFALPLLGIELSGMTSGVLALGLNLGAYASEIVRGAILSIPKGQIEAGIALNMPPGQRMRRIVLPQALKLMLPGFGNNMIEVLKGTSLVSLITLADMTYQSKLLINTMGNPEVVYTMLLIMYFIIALPLIVMTRWFERRASVGGS